MATREITLALLLKNQLSGPAKEAEKSLKAVGSAVNNIVKLASGFAAAFIGFEGIKKAVGEAIKMEESSTRLKAALGENIGAYEQIAKLAEEISDKSIFDDDSLKKAAARIVQIQGGTQGLAKILQTSVDLAAELGTNVEDAATQLLKTAELGTVPKELAILVPALKSLSEESLRAGEAITLTGLKLQGRAEAFAATAGGTLTKFRNQTEQEIGLVGAQILDLLADLAPVALEVVKTIRELFTSSDASAAIASVGAFLKLLLEIGPALVRIIALYGIFKLAVTATNVVVAIQDKGLKNYANTLGTLPRLFTLAAAAAAAFWLGQQARPLIFGEDPQDHAVGNTPEQDRDQLSKLTRGQHIGLWLEDRIPGFGSLLRAMGGDTPSDRATQIQVDAANADAAGLKERIAKDRAARVAAEEITLQNIARLREKFDDNEAERAKAARLLELHDMLAAGQIEVDEFIARTGAITGTEILAKANKIKEALDPIFDLPERFELFGDTFDVNLENAKKIVDLGRERGQDRQKQLDIIEATTKRVIELDDERTKKLIANAATEHQIITQQIAQRLEASRLLEDLTVRRLRTIETTESPAPNLNLDVEAEITETQLRQQRERIDLQAAFNLLSAEEREQLDGQLAALHKIELQAAVTNAVKSKASAIVGEAAEAEGLFNLKLTQTAELFRSGALDNSEVQERNEAAAAQFNATVDIQIEKQNQLLKIYPEQREEIEAQIIALQRLKQAAVEAADQSPWAKFKQGFKDTIAAAADLGAAMQQIGANIGDALTNGIGGALVEIFSRTRKLKDAFADLGASVLKQTAQILFSLGIATAIRASLPGLAAGAGLLGLAEGGWVPGPDMGHDTQLAMLRGGEYVVRPEVASRFGGWLDMLNTGRWLNLPAPSLAMAAPYMGLRANTGGHYAQGGSVQEGGMPGDPKVLPVLIVTRHEASRAMAGGWRDAIVEDMARNPSAYNAALQRGGA